MRATRVSPSSIHRRGELCNSDEPLRVAVVCSVMSLVEGDIVAAAIIAGATSCAFFLSNFCFLIGGRWDENGEERWVHVFFFVIGRNVLIYAVCETLVLEVMNEVLFPLCLLYLVVGASSVKMVKVITRV